MLRMIRERLCSCMLLRARARRTHPIQTMEFLVKVHRAQDRALLLEVVVRLGKTAMINLVRATSTRMMKSKYSLGV